MKNAQLNIIRMVLCMFLMCLPLSARCDNVKFDGRAPSTVRVGEKFQLVYTVSDEASDIRLGDVSGFTVLMGPSQSSSRSVSIVNGNVSQSQTTTFTYVLKADKEGQYTIPAARVTADGKQIQSNSVTIKVVEAGASNSSSNGQGSGSSWSNGYQSSSSNSGSKDDIIIVQSLNRSSVYEGEAVVLTTKIYTRVNLQQISDVKQPDLTQFVASEINPTQQLQFVQDYYNGTVYQAATAYEEVLIPQKSGKIKIDPIEYEFVVKQRTSSGGGFFGSFFDDVQLVRRRVSSNALTLDVKPLPQSNVKTSGGVGDFTFKVSVSPNEVDVDNSVQVKVSVSGEGNLRLLSLPKPQFHSDFDTFDPSENITGDFTAKGFKGTKSAEYLIIPRRDGDFEVPEMKFVYFDPQKSQYVTKAMGPFAIHVNKGEGTQQNQQVTFAGGGREQVQYMGRDLRYLHTDVSDLSAKNEFFVLSPLFFICLLLPLIAFFVVLFVYRKKVQDMNNVSGVKRRRANKAAMKRLKQASKYMKDGKREAFFDEVMRALWGYLSDKLTLPLSVLTKDNAKEEMQKHNISSEAADDFMNLLDACEFARYAPVEMAESMDSVYAKAEDVIEKIEEQM